MISALYQKNILALAAAAHGAGRLGAADGTADLRNPLCGDHVILDVRVADGRITHVGHEVKACVLCQASASILAAAAIGLDAQAIGEGRDAVAAMLAGGDIPVNRWQSYGDLRGVAAFASRHRCVLLPLEAAAAALHAARVAG